jgi:hypothetical protein
MPHKNEVKWISHEDILSFEEIIRSTVEECCRKGKDDLLVSRYYPKFQNLKNVPK